VDELRTVERGWSGAFCSEDATCSVAGPFQRRPDIVQFGPGTVKRVPGAFQRVPPTFQRVPATFQRVPGTFQRVPGTFQRVPGTFQRVPGTFQRVPGAFQRVPGTEAADAASSQVFKFQRAQESYARRTTRAVGC